MLALFLKKNFHLLYPSKWIFLISISTGLFTPLFYWYTSQAFIPNFQFNGQHITYFEFVMSGEILLFLPLSIITNMIQSCKTSLYDQSFHHFILSKDSYVSSQISHIFSYLLLDLPKWFILILFAIFLSPNLFTSGSFVLALLFSISCVPLFYGIGLLSISVLIRFGRGQGLITLFFSFLATLSGLYFPIHVFPNWLTQLISHISPIDFLLSQGRSILFQTLPSSQFTSLLFFLFIWSTLFLILGAFSVHKSIYAYRKKGAQLYLFQ